MVTFIVVILAFGMAIYHSFGMELDKLSSFRNTIYTLFGMTLGVVKISSLLPFGTLHLTKCLIFSTFLIIAKIVLMNLFISTINELLASVKHGKILDNFDYVLNQYLHQKISKWWRGKEIKKDFDNSRTYQI